MNAKGRTLFESLIAFGATPPPAAAASGAGDPHAQHPQFLLDVDRASSGALAQHLRRFRLAFSATVEDVSESYDVIAAFHDGNLAALREAPRHSYFGGDRRAVDGRSGAPRPAPSPFGEVRDVLSLLAQLRSAVSGAAAGASVGAGPSNTHTASAIFLDTRGALLQPLSESSLELDDEGSRAASSAASSVSDGVASHRSGQPPTSYLGLRAIIPRQLRPAVQPALAALPAASASAYHALRCLCGVPEGAEVHNLMPLEWNAVELGAVAFDKGCYVGQELVARTHFRGDVHKRVLPAILYAAAAPQTASPHASTAEHVKKAASAQSASAPRDGNDDPAFSLPKIDLQWHQLGKGGPAGLASGPPDSLGGSRIVSAAAPALDTATGAPGDDLPLSGSASSSAGKVVGSRCGTNIAMALFRIEALREQQRQQQQGSTLAGVSRPFEFHVRPIEAEGAGDSSTSAGLGAQEPGPATPGLGPTALLTTPALPPFWASWGDVLTTKGGPA